MQELIQSYGNMVLFSPKGHPEIAGAGIEYDWGMSKKCFRRANNHIAKNCENDVRLSLGKTTLQITNNTARKQDAICMLTRTILEDSICSSKSSSKYINAIETYMPN